MNECIEFKLTPFEQMMESANVELDDFEIDDVFQEGELFDKISRKFQPVVDSFDFDPKMRKLIDEMNDPKKTNVLQTIKLIIKTIISVITGFIRNIGYRRPSKISKYGTVFVNKDELEYCNETRKQLKKITDNFEELVIGAVLRHESNKAFWREDPEMDKLYEIKRNRKVESVLVSSSKQGKPMTIGELNMILDYTSETIDGLIKKINKGFDISVVPVNPRADKNYDEDAVGECKVTINGKVVYEGNQPFLTRESVKQRYEDVIRDYARNIVDHIDYLKDFQQTLINDVNNLKNIGDNKIDKTIDDYMI